MQLSLVAVFALMSALAVAAYMAPGYGGYSPATTSYLPYMGIGLVLLLVIMYYLNNRKADLYIYNQSTGVQVQVGK